MIQEKDPAILMLYAILEILLDKGMKFSPSIEGDKVVAFMGHLPQYGDTHISLQASDGTLILRLYAQPGLEEPELMLFEMELFRRIKNNLGLPPPDGCYKMSDPKLPTAAQIAQDVLDSVNYFEKVWEPLMRDKEEIIQEIRASVKKRVDAAEKEIGRREGWLKARIKRLIN